MGILVQVVMIFFNANTTLDMTSEKTFHWSPLATNKPMQKSLPIPRARDIVLSKPTMQPPRLQAAIPKNIHGKRKCEAVVEQFPKGNEIFKRQKSVLEMLVKDVRKEIPSEISDPANSKTEKISDRSDYIKEVLQDYSSYLKNNGFWIFPAGSPAAIAHRRQRSGDRLDPKDIWNLCTRPNIFVWDPVAVFPGLSILCPRCRSPAHRCQLCQPRLLRQLGGDSMYVTMEYGCYTCGSTSVSRGSKQRSKKRFRADAPAVRASLPNYVSSLWCFMDTGKMICDVAVVDLVRSLATKSSWSAIASTVNDMIDAAWARKVIPMD